MSDPNKYINYYVENALGMVHEYINIVLQTKTQVKILEDQNQEKDKLIAHYTNELNLHVTSGEELSKAKADATSLQDSYNALRSKLSHMETLAKQVGDAKRTLLEKNSEIEKTKKDAENYKKQVSERDGQIRELKKLIPPELLPKKVLNTKKKTTSEEEPNLDAEKVETVEEIKKPPIVPYTPAAEGSKPRIVPFVPPGEKAEDMVPLKVVNVVDPGKETDDF